MILFRLLRDAAIVTAGYLGLIVAVVHTHQFIGATPAHRHVIAWGITAASALVVVLVSAQEVRRGRRAISPPRQQPRSPYGY